MFWWNVTLPRFNFFIFQTHYLILWKPKPKEQWTLQNLLSCTHVSSCLRQKAWPFLHSFLTLLSCSFSCQDHIHFHQRIYPVFMAKKDLGNTKWSRWLMFYALVACKKKHFWDLKKLLHLDTDLTISWDCTFETIEIGILLELMTIVPPLLGIKTLCVTCRIFISFHLIGLLRMAKKLLRNGKMTF